MSALEGYGKTVITQVSVSGVMLKLLRVLQQLHLVVDVFDSDLLPSFSPPPDKLSVSAVLASSSARSAHHLPVCRASTPVRATLQTR